VDYNTIEEQHVYITLQWIDGNMSPVDSAQTFICYLC